MALFALLGVLRGIDQDKNCSFMNWTPIVFILDSWMDTNQDKTLIERTSRMSRIQGFFILFMIKGKKEVMKNEQHAQY